MKSILFNSKYQVQLSVMVMAIVAAFPVLAEDDPAWFIGANAGMSKARIDNGNVAATKLGNAFTVNSVAEDERDNAYKVLGGIQLNRMLAVEASYFDLGQSGFIASTTPDGRFSGTTSIRGFGLGVVASAPLAAQFSAFARLGANYSEVKDSFSSAGSVTLGSSNNTRHDTNIKYGLGLQYDITPALGLRVEVERYRINDAVDNHGNVDHVSLGLIYRFGASAPVYRERIVAAQPVYVPPPTPVAVVAPVYVPPPAPLPAPVASKVSFSADSLFEFVKSTVTPDGKEVLRKFAGDLRGTNFDVIHLQGNTDRIGSVHYNQKLSEDRANAVKAVLVEVEGIPADKVIASGVAGTDPVTKPEDCVGRKASKTLIACLQPDRRVDVEVVGTRVGSK